MHACVSEYVCMYICTVCVYVCLFIHTHILYIHTHTHTYAYIHIHIYSTYIHTYWCIFSDLDINMVKISFYYVLFVLLLYTHTYISMFVCCILI